MGRSLTGIALIRCLGLLFSVVVLTGLMFATWKHYKAVSMDFVPIRYVRIEGVFQYLGKEEIKKELLPLVATDLFSADIQAIQVALIALPMVKTVNVKRVWPDTVEIKIFEQKPAVRWGEKSLLNQHGEVFSPINIDEFKALPLLIGPKGQELKLYEMMQNISMELKENGLTLGVFKVSERRSWKLTLSNDVELELGRREPFKKFQGFLQTLPILGQEKFNTMAKVDLRYPNGFAVQWKQGEVPQWEPIDD